MSTLTDIRTDVRERIGEDAADFFTDAEVDRAINLGVTTFSAEELWPWLYTTYSSTLLSGVTTKALPDDVSIHRFFNLAIFGGDLSRGRLLERVDPQAGFRIKYSYTALNQAPIYYFVSAAENAGATTYTITFVPTPNTSYDLEGIYLRKPAVLSAGGDEPDIPEEFQPAVPAWAAGHLLLKEVQISQKAQEQFALYNKVAEQARKLLEVHLDMRTAWSRQTPLRRLKPSVFDRISGQLGP
jgi:hypothetical protein